MKLLWIFASLVFAASAFGGSEDRFLKKYAMLKIYESCFGSEIVKQIRLEMKTASEKCAGLEPPPPADTKPPIRDTTTPPNFDAEKLHQAILAFRPNAPPAPFYRPYANQGMAPFYGLPYANPAYAPLMYGGFPQQGYPLLGQPFYGNRVSRDMEVKSQLEAVTSKMSGRIRNVTCIMQELGYLDDELRPNYQEITRRIESLPINADLKRDMKDGVAFCQQFSKCLPEVKTDRSPLSRELMQPMFFFKCYKHKKLESCIMKDIREKYSELSDVEFESEAEVRKRAGKATYVASDEGNDDLATSMYEFLYGAETDITFDNIL